MIFRQRPKDSDLYKYHACIEEDAEALRAKGFNPLYMWDGIFYFKLTKALKDYIEAERG